MEGRVMSTNKQAISTIIDYPLDKQGKLVTRRGGLTRMKPRLDAPPASQPGSIDWTVNLLFGSVPNAVEMIESIVAGQGENADERWIEFILLYRQWELQYREGLLEELPTLNQVCHSLNFDARDFLTQLQGGVKLMMTGLVHTRAALDSLNVMNAVLARAKSMDGTKDSELALKIAGVIDEKGGINIQVNNQNNVLLKGEKDKMKTPLLQFKETIDDIDREVRNSDEEHN